MRQHSAGTVTTHVDGGGGATSRRLYQVTRRRGLGTRLEQGQNIVTVSPSLFLSHHRRPLFAQTENGTTRHDPVRQRTKERTHS